VIYIYECKTAPPNRRFMAQFERIKDNFYVTIHGDTAENAEAKAKLIQQFQSIPPLDRKAFDLKGRMALLGGTVDEDDLL